VIRRLATILRRLTRHALDPHRWAALIAAGGVWAEITETAQEIATAVRSQP
jgi:hypothetical protein